jgi:ABC-2 type transport system permease protein
MTATAMRGTQLDADAPIPFTRLVRTELRKLTDTRASRWLLAAIIAVTPVVVAVMLVVAKPQDLTYARFADFTQAPQKYLLPVLGLLAMTSEWSQRTGLVTFTLVPDRRRVLLAKFTATVALGLAVIAVAFPAAAVGNALGAALRGGDGSWSFGASASADIALVLLTGLVQGMAFGMALLITAAAIAVFYVAPNLWSVLLNSGGLHHVAPWIDLNQAQGPLYDHDITGAGWLQLLVAAAIWVVVPLVIGVARVSRTEVKSG